MQFMSNCSSYTEGLAFAAAVEKLMPANMADKKCHIWPNYCYSWESITYHKDREIVLARALVDWVVEFPDACISNVKGDRVAWRMIWLL